MPSLPRTLLLLGLALGPLSASAAVTPHRRDLSPESSIYKLLASNSTLTLPDLSVPIVNSTSTDVRGDVPDSTDLTTDVVKSATSSVTAEEFIEPALSVSTFSIASVDEVSTTADYPAGFNFLSSCKRHDFGYRNFKKQERFTEANRLLIDNNFKSDLYKECGTHSWLKRGVCEEIADVYYEAVRAFGGL